MTADYQMLLTAATGPGSAIVQRLETLEVDLGGMASVAALNSIGLVATNVDGTISGVGTAISGIMAQVNNSLAQGLFRTYVEATEAGAETTIGISAAASSGGATSQAAVLVSALANGKSMVGLVADQVYMTDAAGNKAYPFVFSGGILRVNQARIGFAQIDDVAIDFATITNVHVTGDMIVDGSIDSPSLALKAVTDSKSSSLPSTALNYSGAPTNVWVDILTVTVANMVTNPIMVSLYLSMGVNNSTLTIRLVRRVGAGDTVLNAYTQTLSSGGGASKIYGPAVSFDAGAPSGSITYVIQYNYSPGSGGGTTAALAAEITAMIFKR